MESFYDAFISYGRIDSKTFALKIHQKLTAAGYRVWFDQTDIPLAVDFQEQIKDGIARSHNFLFIISPHAVNSDYCAKELNWALRHHKRIIPIMHVEEVSYATWQARHPEKTQADWLAHQASGQHSSYPNMPKAISRINWIFWREQDDEALALQGLLAILHRHQNYVHQHTALLARALTWERYQRQTSYLLTGHERATAEAWLKQRFEDEQAPCDASPLQAEYICESTKYAEGFLTQVFLAHAEADREQERKVRLSLMHSGITVWSSKTDIQSGKDFQTAIYRGIENADNLLILLSPQALKSPYCQQELAYGFALNKRIIPLLLKPITGLQAEDIAPSPEAIPQVQATLAHLQKLQFIDFTAYESAVGFRTSLDRLLRRLQEDAAYLRTHKDLLVRAFKWHRQHQNPSILLRGVILQYYNGWEQLAHQHPDAPLTDLQQQFLQASRRHPPQQTLDVFLACGPADLDFGRKLNDTLQIQGKTTWFLAEITSEVEVSQADVFRGLEKCQNVVVVVSPSWLEAEACQVVFAYAQELNKRIIPVWHRPVAAETLPSQLIALKGIDLRDKHEFLERFGDLYRTLESDPDHVRGHTRLLIKAREWEQSQFDDSFLLRGKGLREAVTWLQQAMAKSPTPTVLQKRYIEASQTLPRRKVRLRTVAWSSAGVTACVALARLLGWLQPLELALYDQLLRLRPPASPDERMLIVAVDETSGSWLREKMKSGDYTPGIGTLPDAALQDALTVLNQNGAALIGLDFYRDFQASPELANTLATADNVIGLCKGTYGLTHSLGAPSVLPNQDGAPVTTPATDEDIPYQSQGVEKPPEIPLSRIGFNDLVQDRSLYVRRHYLRQTGDPVCPAEAAFSLVLAQRYLANQGIPYQDPWKTGASQPMKLGDVVIPQLWSGGLLVSQSAGYSSRDPSLLAGYQTMINFRAVKGEIEEFAPTVTLAALLAGEIDPEQIRDRIVLIGYTDLTDRSADLYNTPYGWMHGAFLQGQMTSQLISAVLDDRPLIWWWPAWGDLLWIGGWAVSGGVLARWSFRARHLIFVGLGGIGILYAVSFGVLVIMGGWLPLGPGILAFLSTGGVVVYVTYQVRHP